MKYNGGYGRRGNFSAHQFWYEVQPDIIIMAKVWANGFPPAVYLYIQNTQQKYGMLGTTFWWRTIAQRAALAVLEIMETEQLIENTITVEIFNSTMQRITKTLKCAVKD